MKISSVSALRGLAAALGLAAAVAPLGPPAAAGEGSANSACEPGLVLVEGTDKQPIGMDEKDYAKFVDEDMGGKIRKSEKFKYYWGAGMLLSTPRHERSVGDVMMSHYEVSNAQWSVFLQSKRNANTLKTNESLRTLSSIAAAFYGVDPDDTTRMAEFLRVWEYILHRNYAVLEPHVKPLPEPLEEEKPLPKRWWIREQAHLKKLPVGLELNLGEAILPLDLVAWNADGTIKEGFEKRPVHGVSWLEAVRFCRWAGYHLPREFEWERAARGAEGRRFPWGDDLRADQVVWKGNGDPSGPEDVDTQSEAATPGTRLHHMAGNVAEWVYDMVDVYDGSKTTFEFDDNCMLARGGNYLSTHEFDFLATARMWDQTTALAPKTTAEGIGFRVATYPNAGMDVSYEADIAINNIDAVDGPFMWIPPAIGISEKKRDDVKTCRPLIGTSAARGGGWMRRHIKDGSGGQHVYAHRPANGVAFLPIKGILKESLKQSSSLEKLAAKEKEICFIGVLCGTENGQFKVVNDVVETVDGEEQTKQVESWFSFGDDRFWNFNSVFDHPVPIGAYLVLEKDRVAVYSAQPGSAGQRGAHLKRAPLGYLPAPWVSKFGSLSDLAPSGVSEKNTATLTSVIPRMNLKDGTVLTKKSDKAVAVTIDVELKWEDR